MRKLLLYCVPLFLSFSNLCAEWLADSIINDNNRRCRTGYNVSRCLTALGNNVYAVWTEEGYDVFLKAKQNGTWTNSERVSVGSPGGIYGLSANPSIYVSASTINVVWEDYRTGDFEIFYRKFSSSGWGNPINLSGDAASSRVPVITVTDAGKIFLIWQDDRDGNYEIYSRLNIGGTWGNTDQLSNTTYYAGFPTIAHLGETVYAVWEQLENYGYELYYSEYTGNWSSPQRITDTEGMSQNPSIAIDAGGILHLVWTEDTEGNFVVYYSKYENSSWTSPVAVTSNPGEALYPQITSDPFGVIHLVWSDNRNGNYEILHRTLVNGSWSPSLNISEKEGVSSSPHIVCTIDGAVHIIWYDWAEDSVYASPHIVYRRFNPTTAALSHSVNVEIHNAQVNISASSKEGKLTLFRIDTLHPFGVSWSQTNGTTYKWSKLLPPGEYSYIIQSITGIAVHYSEPIEISIPEECLKMSTSPNPFSTKTEIRCQVPGLREGTNTYNLIPITLRIYDASGRLVKRLTIDDLRLTNLSWDGRDMKGRNVVPGIYFIQLKNSQNSITKKLVKIK